MLKIKDNIGLKELKKYGFDYDMFFGALVRRLYEGRRGQTFDIIIVNKVLMGYSEGADGDGELDVIDDFIFDLIKDGLVEKY